MKTLLILLVFLVFTTGASCQYTHVHKMDKPKHHSSHEDKPKVEKPKDSDCRK
jgi:hypothetical protein